MVKLEILYTGLDIFQETRNAGSFFYSAMPFVLICVALE